ncbi:hypothetical protein [Streptomyces sp. CB03238]|uniref:hypothetical protein n=1 Tax=Streptomyces sp. CB03238 TaxID=1907777 RepID=UPI0032195BB3
MSAMRHRWCRHARRSRAEESQQPDSLWRIRDFRTLFTATLLSQFGTNTGYVAVPLIAVSALDATPGQVGALAALSTAAFLAPASRPGPGWTGCAIAAC